MKLIKNLLFGLLSLSLIACSGNQVNSNNGASFLKIGDTAKTGKLSQTVKRLDYVPTNSSLGVSENDSVFELEYLLHSEYETITALGGTMGYSAVFDGNTNNGGLYMFGSMTAPDSIAPNSNETVILTLKCFKDWKTAVISYKDNNNNAYSFSIRSSDYQDYTNNDYPVLKLGNSFVEDSGRVRITFKRLKTTIVGSAGVGNDSDNLEFVVGLTSLTNENINLPMSTYGYYLKCDAGFSSGNFNIGTPNLPSSLPAKGSVDLEMIITISKQWQKLVFGYTSNDRTLSYRFMLVHSEISYS